MTDIDLQDITLGGQSIGCDYGGEIGAFVSRWLSVDAMRLVFEPKSRLQSDSAFSESSVYESPLPDLPPLCVNQYQIPTGISRYSRGLFMMDKWDMARLALQAFQEMSFDAVQQMTEDTLSTLLPGLFSEFLDADTIVWGAKNSAVPLRYNLEFVYEEDVYLLRPIRVPHASRDVWLVPVVDYRYNAQAMVRSKTDKALFDRGNHTTWQEYIDFQWSQVTESPNKSVDVSGALGVPDVSVLNSRKPIVNTLETLIHTVGYRYVPRYGLMDYDTSVTARDKQVASDLIIAGGLSGQADVPKKVRVVAKKARDWFYGDDWSRLSDAESHSINAFPDTYVYEKRIPAQSPDNDDPEGNEVVISSVWAVNIPTSPGSSEDTHEKFEDFADEVAINCIVPWMKENLDITYAGIPKSIADAGGPADTFFLSGFDDWACISISPVGDVTTRVQSLMSGWAPKYLIAQDPDDMTHYGPAYFIADADIPVAVAVGGGQWKLGQGRAFFMRLRWNGEGGWHVKRTDVYSNVHNTLGSFKAKAGWPMQAKFIGGVWCIDVAECA